jgi:competence protein ComFC
LHQMSGETRKENFSVTLTKKKQADSFFKVLELMFFPSFCKLCGELLNREGEKVVCTSCLKELKPRRSSYCLCCGSFFETYGDPHLCYKCMKRKPVFSLQRSCSVYRGKLKDLILLFKYQKFKVLGEKLASYMYRSLLPDEALWWDLDAVIPVPLHKARKRKRGFNQSYELARYLADFKGLELLENALIKKVNVPPQTSLPAEQRKINNKGAYKVVAPQKIKGKILLLVDDVYTTGATVSECSSVLLKSGAREVRVATLAQAS